MKKTNILLSIVMLFAGFAPAVYAQQGFAPGQEYSAAAEEQTQSEKISLDIKGMDIIDVLKILAMRANLNIVAGKNVRGKVTVFLNDVDPMDALEIILTANELAYEKKGDIINVMTEKDYELLYGESSYDKKTVKIIQLKFAKSAEVCKSINQIRTKIGKVIVDESSNTIVLIDVPQRIKKMEEAVENMDLPTVTKTFILNYAKVEDLEDKIRESLTKNIGELKIDERMNKMVVTDLPERMDYLGRIINEFDERDKVVLIEAKIVQITLSKDTGFGINWNNVFAGIDTVAQSDLSINLPGVTAPTTFTYTRSHGSAEYGDKVILRLLEKLGRTNVLSTPRITVANNQEAKVLVGTKEAYVTSTITQGDGTTTTADNVQFVDVGVSLSVTPTIAADGYINMKIKPEVSAAPTSLELKNADGSVRTSVPIVTTSEAETQLLVKDGTTVILAGLMKDTRKDNTEKIPVLGDMPLLGNLFKSRGKENEKTELVIFLTPHVIAEGENASEDVQEFLRQHEQTAQAEKGTAGSRQITEPRIAEILPFASGAIETPPGNFPQYCNYISNKINRSIEKNMPREVKEQEVRLSFLLTCDGVLKEKPQLLTKAEERVEDMVIKSVEEASPFFPFPQDCSRPEETFKLTIRFAENP